MEKKASFCGALEFALALILNGDLLSPPEKQCSRSIGQDSAEEEITKKRDGLSGFHSIHKFHNDIKRHRCEKSSRENHDEQAARSQKAKFKFLFHFPIVAGIVTFAKCPKSACEPGLPAAALHFWPLCIVPKRSGCREIPLHRDP